MRAVAVEVAHETKKRPPEGGVGDRVLNVQYVGECATAPRQSQPDICIGCRCESSSSAVSVFHEPELSSYAHQIECYCGCHFDAIEEVV